MQRNTSRRKRHDLPNKETEKKDSQLFAFNCIRIVHMNDRNNKKSGIQDHQLSRINGSFTLKCSDCGHGFCFTIIKLQIGRFAQQITFEKSKNRCRKKTAKFTHSFKYRQCKGNNNEEKKTQLKTIHIETEKRIYICTVCLFGVASIKERCNHISRAKKKTFRKPLTSSTTDCPRINSYVKLIYLNSTFKKARY